MEISIHEQLKEIWGEFPSNYVVPLHYWEIEEIKTLYSDSRLFWTSYDGESKIALYLHNESKVAFVLLTIGEEIKNIQVFFTITNNSELMELLDVLSTELEIDGMVDDGNESGDDDDDSGNEIVVFHKTNNDGLFTSVEKIRTQYPVTFWGKDHMEKLESIFDNPDIYGLVHITGAHGVGKSSYMDFVGVCAASVERMCMKIPSHPIFFGDNDMASAISDMNEPPVIFIEDIDWMINQSLSNYGYSPIDYIIELLNKKSSWDNSGPIIVVSSVNELPESLENKLVYRYELGKLGKSQLDHLNRVNKTKSKGEYTLSKYWNEHNGVDILNKGKEFGL